MQYRCASCGKLIKGPGPYEPARTRYYCPVCEDKVATVILNQEAAFRREIARFWDDLRDATGNKIWIGSAVPIKQVLVYSGMVKLAKLFGEEIIVAEEEMKSEWDKEWSFMIWHNQIQYVYFTRGDNPEDAKVIREWRKNHETF